TALVGTHDDRVVVEVERALAIDLLDAAVATVVDHVGRADRAVDQDVAVDEGGAVLWQLLEDRERLLGIDEVEGPAAALNAVVADDAAGRPVLERRTARALAQR